MPPSPVSTSRLAPRQPHNTPQLGASLSPLMRSRVRAAWYFLFPALLILALVAGWPLLRTMYFGFTDARLSTLNQYHWIWFENYYYLFQDRGWWIAVYNSCFFAVISVTFETLLGLAIALVMNVHLPGRGLVRAAVLVPWAIPTIVSAQMWNWMYNDIYGVLNKILQALGLINAPLAWTADPHLAIWAIILVDVWKTTPFMALLILAALQSLPLEIYEAARLDGIPAWVRFWRITLPLIRPALMVAVIFRMLDALRIFDAIYVLTGNNQNTMSMSIYARQQLVDFQEVGFGSAASTLLFLLIALFAIIYITLGKVTMEER
jgi:trehalose/maltose transport system permease protein